jgi:hypothetical protein
MRADRQADMMNLPMKMEPIESSETSANNTQTPGTYPKESKLQIHDEANNRFRHFAKARKIFFLFHFLAVTGPVWPGGFQEF